MTGISCAVYYTQEVYMNTQFSFEIIQILLPELSRDQQVQVKIALDFLGLSESAGNVKHAVALLKARKIWK